MKCSIFGCHSVYDNKKAPCTTSFHGFPNNPEVLTAWVAATGTPNFIPTHKSKICGNHFDESAFLCLGNRRKLKPDAIPTKFLTEDATMRVSKYFQNTKNEQNYNPVTCILGTETELRQVDLMRDSLPPPVKNITVSLHPPPPPLTPAPGSTIKVVDMKKLLQSPLQSQPVVAVSKLSPPSSVSTELNSLVNRYIPKKHLLPIDSYVNRTGITASQVLTCLRVILPGKFDLSRMIPNEKVSSLVIRYLKLDEKNEEIQHAVKEHLKIIIESVKKKDKKSEDFAKHPYTKVGDRDLKRALALILPENFSMIDITNELLGLLCVSLNLDIHTDAYYILIRKIRKFTSEGQKFNEILNRGNKVCDTSLDEENDIEVVKSVVQENKEQPVLTNNENSADSEIESPGGKRRELVFVDVNNPPVINQESADIQSPIEHSSPENSHDTSKPCDYSSDSSSEFFLKGYKRKTKKSEELDSDWKPENKPRKSEKAEENKIGNPKLMEPDDQNLMIIVKYLHEKKQKAKDVLTNYQMLFHLCRHIQSRLKNSSVRNVKSKLNYIIEHKLDINNVKDHLLKLRGRESCVHKHTRLLRHSSSSDMYNNYDKKLKMKPVVVLQDLIDFKCNQLLFMKKKKVKSNGFYKQAPFSVKQNSSNQNYSTEDVRKLTDDSYKQFRRIILKRDGTKGVFRLKYAKLSPGTVVYARNFRHPAVGWVKGVVSKAEGPLKYRVTLDNSSGVWCCTVDQLRPVLNKVVNDVESQRRLRPIKPKQLFDL